MGFLTAIGNYLGNSYSTVSKAIILATTNLVSWVFDTTSGQTATAICDIVGPSNRAIQNGKCYLFDGVDDKVLVTSASLGTVHSFSLWIKSSNPKITISGGSGHYLLNNATVLQYYAASVGVQVALVPDGAVWRHIVCTRDGTAVNFYSNGVKLGVTYTLASNPAFTFNCFGGYDFTNAQCFVGNMHDVRIYSTALTQDEITYIYTDGLSGTDPTTTNLIRAYHCEEGAQAIAYDSSGSGYNGTITNATLATFHSTSTGVRKNWFNDVGGSIMYNNIIYASSLTSWTNNLTTLALADLNGNGNLALRLKNADTTNAQHRSYVGGNFFGPEYFVMYLKPSGIRYVAFKYTGGGVGSVDLQTVTFTSITNLLETSIVADANGWYKVSWRNSTSVASPAFQIACNTSVSITVPDGTFSPTNTTDYVDFFIGCFPITLPNAFPYPTTGTAQSTNVYMPRKENDTTKNMFGFNTTSTGRVGYDMNYMKSNCLSFDGVNDRVEISGMASLTTVHSFAWWAKGVVTNTLFFSGNSPANGYAWLNSGGVARYYATGSATVTVSYTTEATLWHHFVVTRNGTAVNFYVDGIRVGTQQTLGANDAMPVTTQLTGYNNNTFLHPGQMCDARIYTKELSVAEITFIYTRGVNGTNPTTANLLAHWPLAEGGDSKAFDISGNNYHGTLTNFTLASAWGTKQDHFHYNIKNGFEYYDDDATHTDIVRVPHKASATLITPSISGYSKISNNPSGTWHNNAETVLQSPNAPKMQVINDAEANNFLFDSSDVVKDVTYALIVKNVNNTNFFFADISVTNQKKNLLFYASTKSGSDLTNIQNYLRH